MGSENFAQKLKKCIRDNNVAHLKLSNLPNIKGGGINNYIQLFQILPKLLTSFEYHKEMTTTSICKCLDVKLYHVGNHAQYENVLSLFFGNLEMSVPALM